MREDIPDFDDDDLDDLMDSLKPEPSLEPLVRMAANIQKMLDRGATPESLIIAFTAMMKASSSQSR